MPRRKKASGPAAVHVEAGRNVTPFHVVRIGSHALSLGGPRVGQRQIGRWNPPPRLFEI
jgi:hypothetical protein